MTNKDDDLSFLEEKSGAMMRLAEYEASLSRARAGAEEPTKEPTPKPSPWPARGAAVLGIYWALKGQEVRAVVALGATYYLVKKNIIEEKKAEFSDFVKALL